MTEHIQTQRKQTAPAIRRMFEGDVVSNSAPKTIRVLVRRIATHAKYRKQYTVSRKYPVHDELGQAKVGDRVLFQECRPISKTKRWRLIRVVRSSV